MAFLLERSKWFDSKVTCRCRLHIVDEVYNKLDDAHKDLFKTSCFGNLYKMRDNMNMVGKLTHALNMMRIKPINDLNEVWFCIGGKKIRFGFSDYTLITGLHPGIEENFISEIPGGNRLRNEYFGGVKKSIKPKELMEAFLNRANNEEDRYKLGLSLVYEYVLRARENTTQIDAMVLDIVDNLEVFNRYPWGTRTYNHLLVGLTRKIEGRANHVSYYGFTYALQVNV